jgi:hypothetical protein
MDWVRFSTEMSGCRTMIWCLLSCQNGKGMRQVFEKPYTLIYEYLEVYVRGF